MRYKVSSVSGEEWPLVHSESISAPRVDRAKLNAIRSARDERKRFYVQCDRKALDCTQVAFAAFESADVGAVIAEKIRERLLINERVSKSSA